MAKDYYEILGVKKDATADQIKSAYRLLAKQYHPDVNKDPGAANKFKEINQAYETLGDENKRANYDQYGSAEGNPYGDFFGGGGGGGGGFQGFGGFSEIFGDLFSGFGMGGRTAGREKGQDIEVSLTISFEEAAFGVKKDIKIPRTEQCSACQGRGSKNGKEDERCPDCGGNGKVRYQQQTIFGTTITEGICKKCSGRGRIIKEKCSECAGSGTKKISRTVSVSIPAGIDNGQVINMRGEGNAPSLGSANGDLRIHVQVLSHKLLIRKGFDLFLEVHVPFTTMLLGGDIDVPTLQGRTTLKIKELTQTNTVVSLKGKGIKHLNSSRYGDLYLTLRTEVPKNLDKEVRAKLVEISEKIADRDYVKYKTYMDNLK